MIKHKIYMGANCTQSDQPKRPSNSSISLYTCIVCISGLFTPMNGFQTSAIHATMQENIESTLVPGVQVYHHPTTLAYQNRLNPLN